MNYYPVKAAKATLSKKPNNYTKEQRQCWKTPNTKEQPVLYLVSELFGGQITLDPTSDDYKSVPANFHFTKDDDCLKKDWNVSDQVKVFMNCPFDKPHLYIEKLFNEYNCGKIDEAVLLLKAGTIHNKKSGYFLSYATAFCHWGKKGRMAFIDHLGYQVKGADFDTLLVYFGNNIQLFKDLFEDYGTITRPVI